MLPWCFHSTKHTLSRTPNLLEGSEPARISCPWLLLDGERLPSTWSEPPWLDRWGTGPRPPERPCSPPGWKFSVNISRVTSACGAGRAERLRPGHVRHLSTRDHHPNCFWPEQPWGNWNTSDLHYRFLTINRAGFGSDMIWLSYHLHSYLQTTATTCHLSPQPHPEEPGGGTAFKVLCKPLQVPLFPSPNIQQHLTLAITKDH